MRCCPAARNARRLPAVQKRAVLRNSVFCCTQSMSISVVIPVLNEQTALPLLLADLQALRRSGAEIIVVDGGSSDATMQHAQRLADKCIEAPRGRASQLNAGAAVASGELLWFLHADSRVGPALLHALSDELPAACEWGFFRVRLVGRSPMLGVIGACMWWRSRLSGIATGDQGIFVRRALFQRVGGFPQQALMEDIEFSSRLRRVAAPHAFAARLRSSGRRWDRNGAWRTIVLMWSLRLRYFLGASPARLYERYYGSD
jgi:rSAM/selenodomain-associated transferase 2